MLWTRRFVIVLVACGATLLVFMFLSFLRSGDDGAGMVGASGSALVDRKSLYDFLHGDNSLYVVTDDNSHTEVTTQVVKKYFYPMRQRGQRTLIPIVQAVQLLMSRIAAMEKDFSKQKHDLLLRMCKARLIEVGDHGGWCKYNKATLKEEHDWNMDLANWLERKLFAGKTVADFGAGANFYSSFFKYNKKVKRVAAYDGALGIEESSEDSIKFLDLASPARVSEEVPVFDWVLSLEVGEHIPAASEQVFLDNLARHAREGVVLSWAVPGQDGFSHVNNLPNEYIIQNMERRGFVFERDMSQEARAIPSLKVKCPWFINTIMIFKRSTDTATRHQE